MTTFGQCSTRLNDSRQAGFSSVELMVGLIIGLLATLAIVQVFSIFEGQKRSTSGTSDAQTNGSIALMNIQRSVQMAGYGLALPMADKDNSSLKCAAFADYDPPAISATNDPPPTNLFPLVIQDGAGNTSDTITVRYSTTAMGALPVSIVNAANATGATGMVLSNNIGCSVNDIALVSNGSVCGMTTVVDANGNPDTLQNLTVSSAPAGALVNNAKFACMGNWRDYTYQIVNNELLLNGQPIVSEVVNMQAQYGVSAAANSNQVSQWVNATGGTWAAPTVANRNRIKAIRVAVVVRNSLLEKEVVSTACSSTIAANPSGVCAWDGSVLSEAPAVVLTGTDWERYRYRVFETIVPVRNMLWSREAV
jgi:type IV pilus assembly protein PilW